MNKSFVEAVNIAIEDIGKKYNGGLRSTSIRRFDELSQIVASFFGLAKSDIKIIAAGKASNAWNRFVEGRAVHSHFRLGIGILSGMDSGSALSPVKTFIGRGKSRYDCIALITKRDGRWVFTDIVSDDKKTFVDVFQRECPGVNVHIIGAHASVSLREKLFSGLETKFDKWLVSHGVKQAHGKYVRNLKAIGLPFEKEYTGKSGKWDGFYEYLIGTPPKKGVFEVSGLADFEACYGAIKSFFMTEDPADSGSFDKQKFDKWFWYFHAAPTKRSVQRKDQRATLSAYVKYLQFLQEQEKQYCGVVVAAFDGFCANISNCGLTYSPNLIRRFMAALLAKPFVILTGLSGSGKTKIAEAFTRWLCGTEAAAGNCKLVAVGADWANSEKLLGYPDALHKGSYVNPDTGILQFLQKAVTDGNRPYFLILDEMNLSHVERYFADFLSSMESTGGVIRLHDEEKGMGGVPPTLPLPRNLFVIGTMNVDETTYMFSPKVLDRAQVIEFRVSKEEMLAYLDAEDSVILDELCDENGIGKGNEFAEGFLAARGMKYPLVAEAKTTLAEFFAPLAKLGSEFGYRTASEFQKFVAIFVQMGGAPEEAVDFAIMQKLLPKLHGSRRKLEKPLKKLWNLCLKDYKPKDKGWRDRDVPSADAEVVFAEQCRYPVSAEKILRMLRTAQEVGFASYAEA